MGVPFYGYEESTPMVNHEMEEKMKSTPQGAKEMQWNEESREDHFYRVVEGEVEPVWSTFPTPRFVDERIELAKKLNVGISIWEMGQNFKCLFQTL